MTDLLETIEEGLAAAHDLRAQAFASTVDQMPNLMPHKMLTKHMANAIRGHYMSADVPGIIKKCKSLEINPGAHGSAEKIAAICKDHMGNIADHAHMPGMVDAMTNIAKHGRMNVEHQAAQYDRYLPDDLRMSVDGACRKDFEARTNQLFVSAHGKVDNGRQSLTDQRAPHTMNVNDHHDMAAMVKAGMMQHPASDEDAADHVKKMMPGLAQKRAMDAATHEGIRAYNIGFSRTARTMGATEKTWTMAADPMLHDHHHKQAGQTVPLDRRHLDGSMWPGEGKRCNCGSALGWPMPAEPTPGKPA